MASTSLRMSRTVSWFPWISQSWERMTSGSAISGPRALLRSCATPPASTLSASIRFVAAARSCTLRSCSMLVCTSSSRKRTLLSAAAISLRNAA